METTIIPGDLVRSSFTALSVRTGRVVETYRCGMTGETLYRVFWFDGIGLGSNWRDSDLVRINRVS